MIIRMQARQPVTKPRISKCGTHWTVEWNRRGDFYPMHVCRRTFDEVLSEAERVVRGRLHA